MEEWDLKSLLFIYWKDTALDSVETYFWEDSAYVSLNGATTDVWEGRFSWICLEISLLLKYKNRGVGPKNFIV